MVGGGRLSRRSGEIGGWRDKVDGEGGRNPGCGPVAYLLCIRYGLFAGAKRRRCIRTETQRCRSWEEVVVLLTVCPSVNPVEAHLTAAKRQDIHHSPSCIIHYHNPLPSFHGSSVGATALLTYVSISSISSECPHSMVITVARGCSQKRSLTAETDCSLPLKTSSAR